MTSSGGRPRVVLTRADDDNKSLAAQLEPLGVDAVSVPMIEVRPPADGGNALSAALADIDLYHWLVLTSPNGVRATASTLRDLALDRSTGSDPDEPFSEAPPMAESSALWPEHLRLAVVGPTTANAAARLGWPVAFRPSEASGSHLVREFPEPPATSESVFGPERLLAALAELAAPTVVKGLRRRGYHVDQVTAYRTVEPAALADTPEGSVDLMSGADAVAFASPSAVDRFVHRFGLDATPSVVVCIGPSTARRAKARKLTVAGVAKPHTEAGLVQAITDLLTNG